MTKTKFFIFLMLSLMGGLVLSAPSDALAADKEASKSIAQNKEKEKSVENFIAEFGIKSSQQSSAHDAYLKANANFTAELQIFSKLQGQVSLDCAKAFAKNTATTIGEDISDILESDSWSSFWDNIGKTGEHLWDALGSAGQNALSTIQSNLQYMLVPACIYDYVSMVTPIETVCESSGTPEKFKASIDKLKAQGEKVNMIKKEACILEDAGADGVVYEHCEMKDSHGKKITEEDGTPRCFKFVVNVQKNTIESYSGVTQGCAPLPFNIWEARSCLFCPLFKIIFDTIQQVSTKAFNMFGKDLAKLLLIGLAIWIAYMVMQNVSSMTKQDAPKFLNDLFRASFKIVIVFILLRNSHIVYDIIIGPLLKAGFEFGVSFLSYSDSSKLGSCESLKTTGFVGSGVLPQYVYANLLCFIEAVQFELATTQAIGESLVCVATHSANSTILGAKILPDFSMMFQGILIFIISLILSLAFGFFLIDATIQLGIFGMLLPFLLLCWPFKITTPYAKKGIEVFMNSWFVYVFMGVVVNISLQLIGKGLTGGKGGFDAVEKAINGNEITKLQELLSIGFSGFVILISCCVFAIKLMQKVEDLAGKFSGGLNLGIGGNVGGLIAQSGTNLAKFGVQKAGGMAMGAGKKVLNARIFGQDGAEWSIGDKFRSAKHSVARGVGRGLTATGRGIGKGVSMPFNAIGAAFRHLKGRRNPSA